MKTTVENVCVDILICNYNTRDLIKPMVDCVEASQPKPKINYLIVDNASNDDSVNYIRRNHTHMRLIENSKNVGFGRANNQLVNMVTSDYVLLLNTDAFVSPDTLAKSIEFMQEHPECGVLGVKLHSRDGALQPSCRYFPTPWNIFLTKTGLGKYTPWVRMVDDLSWKHDSPRECDWVPGCYYLTRKSILDEIGLFDPRFFLYYEEVDHCKRVKQAGWKVYFLPDTSVVHVGGESAKSAGSITKSGRQISTLQTESELLYIRKHHGMIGFMLHMVLSLTSDVLSLLKSFVTNPKCNSKRTAALNSMRLLLDLAKKTKLGTASTR